MKQLLITIVTVVLLGCGESRQSATAPETKPAEPVAEAKKQNRQHPKHQTSQFTMLIKMETSKSSNST
jgi:outer membrane biogenesis lipoprotein LolB